MKTKSGIFAVVAIAGIFLTGCKTPSPANIEGTQSLKGLNLKLVAKHKPLHLYIYADTSSTNKHPDYVVFERNEPLIISENKSNAVEITLWEENSHGNLATTYGSNGQVLRRSFSTLNDDSTQTNYLYFDKNGDGQWDFFHIDEKNTGSAKSFMQSNFCWVPIQ